jgi:hypothetical protein
MMKRSRRKPPQEKAAHRLKGRPGKDALKVASEAARFALQGRAPYSAKRRLFAAK